MKANFVRKALFCLLPFGVYLRVLSKMYFISLDLGMLKSNRIYAYPYFLDKILKKGDVCIDIGANLGYIAVLLARAVGKEGKVYAVEPVKPILSVLESNTKKFGTVEILPYALGSEEKTIKLGNDSVGKKGYMATGSNYVVEGDAEEVLEFDAEMKIGSELFKDLQRLDFIKVDIEGYETIVIPEMKPVIEKHKPMILVESQRGKREEIMDFLEELGYNSLALDDAKLYFAKRDERWDILFVHETRMELVEHYLRK